MSVPISYSRSKVDRVVKKVAVAAGEKGSKVALTKPKKRKRVIARRQFLEQSRPTLVLTSVSSK